jgi:long-chain fatty acid transport protein
VVQRRSVNSFLLAYSALGALIAATVDANAGGFALSDQSTYGQGSSYAGVAAGGSLSSMFWNPATTTQMPGIQSEIVATAILPYGVNAVAATSTLAAFGGTNNIGNNSVLPSGYGSWQVNPNTWVAISLNTPFAVSGSFPNMWAGRDYAMGSPSLNTYNATPSFSYKFNDWISVGFGVQIEYGHATLSQGPTPPIPGLGNVPFNISLSGNGWGYGFTAGVTLTPAPTTTIGVGYRSAVDQKISGTLTVSGPFALPGTATGGINTTLDLPDIVSLGLRLRLTPQFTLLSTVEWMNWSRIGTSVFNLASGGPATFGGVPVAIPFQYHDGWFFSVGGEYQWTDRLAVRAGVAYEVSPVTDQVRTPLVPDNDQTRLSVGSTFHISKGLSLDFAYSHIFVRDTSINISAASGNPSVDGVTYVGSLSPHIDVVSVGLKYRWDDDATAPAKTFYTK